jgi:DNA-binding CsgD family transcriptional regulator
MATREAAGALSSTMVIGAAVPSLVRLGRSPRADMVYRALVTHRPDTAAGLARDLGCSAWEVGQALLELEMVGAVARSAAKPSAAAVWHPKPPHEVLARLRRMPKESTPATPARPLLDLELLGTDLDEGVRHLRTRALTRARLSELVRAERHEHLAINTERNFDAASTRSAAPLDRDLLTRGVRMRTIGLPPAPTDQPSPIIRELGDLKSRAEYRQRPSVPAKLIVLDRRIALFPVDPHDFERGYLEVCQPSVVQSLVALFERCWSTSTRPQETDMLQINLTARERLLVELLASGHSDASAARELRVSSRTVSNMVRSLMDRLEVGNRFQLGLALGALGATAIRPSPPPIAASAKE